VLDDLPYFVEQAPEPPSALQRALSPRGAARRSGQVCLILCGSTFTLMRGLLSGSAPLRRIEHIRTLLPRGREAAPTGQARARARPLSQG